MAEPRFATVRSAVSPIESPREKLRLYRKCVLAQFGVIQSRVRTVRLQEGHGGSDSKEVWVFRKNKCEHIAFIAMGASSGFRCTRRRGEER